MYGVPERQHNDISTLDSRDGLGNHALVLGRQRRVGGAGGVDDVEAGALALLGHRVEDRVDVRGLALPATILLKLGRMQNPDASNIVALTL